jgi:hypothetical protein
MPMRSLAWLSPSLKLVSLVLLTRTSKAFE